MASSRLFAHLAVPQGHIHRIQGEADPALEARRYAEQLQNLLPADSLGFSAPGGPLEFHSPM